MRRRPRKQRGLAVNASALTMIVPASSQPTAISLRKTPGQIQVETAARLEFRETANSSRVRDDSPGKTRGGEK